MWSKANKGQIDCCGSSNHPWVEWISQNSSNVSGSGARADRQPAVIPSPAP